MFDVGLHVHYGRITVCCFFAIVSLVGGVVSVHFYGENLGIACHHQ